MNAIGANPLVLIGLAAALAALILLARRHRPRRIGMGDAEGSGGAVSRARGRPKRTPTGKRHARHGPEWRTDAKTTPEAKPARAVAEAASLHDRMQTLAERRRKGEKTGRVEALSVITGSREAAAAAPKALRFARVAIFAWLALWGFSAAMIFVDTADSGVDGDALIALPFVAIPLALGVFGLRFLRRIERRISAQERR